MIDFKKESTRIALRDFVKTRLQREGKDPYWLIDRSRLSRETVIDRMLAQDQSNKPAPRQTTLNKLFDALDCQFEDFEHYLQSTYSPQQTNELEDIKSLVGEMRQLITDSQSQPNSATHNYRSHRTATSKDASHLFTHTASERRQLTVVMYNIIGWTNLSQSLDAEDLADLLFAYRDLCADNVSKFGGTIAEYVGDEVLAYFGYPLAHEDDAERAIRAALDTVADLDEIRSNKLQIDIRCGVATGTMVVRNLTPQVSAKGHDLRASKSLVDTTAVGDAPNLAKRLQQLAEPNAVVISERTQRLVKDMFEYRELGSVKLKGFAEPVHVWQVLSEGTIRSRFSALRLPALTPLIGRSTEIAKLSELWEVARKGAGRIVVISGDAGIGKSRLAETVAEQIVSSRCIQFWYYCSPHLQNSALAPVINHLKITAGFSPNDTSNEKIKKLERTVPAALPQRDETIALMLRLLSLDDSDHYPLQPMSPQRERRRLFHALFKMLVTLTAHWPGLIVVEDLHWMDPSTDEFIGQLVHKIGSLPILVVLTTRSEFQSHWEDLDNVDSFSLCPLNRTESEALIMEVSGQANLPTGIVTRIIDKTDGVPLFIEDVTQDLSRTFAVRDSGEQVQVATTTKILEVPDTLHYSLMSRLDRLGSDAKRIVQIGATIGREFTYQLLADISRMENQGIKDILVQLENADVLHARRTPSALIYVFKHALVQDAAYASLLKPERRQLHLRVAEVLEDTYPEICDETPELLAHHFEEAGKIPQAVDYWLAAGKRSVKRSNYVEAIDQLNRSLRLTQTLPVSNSRIQKELEIYLSIGGAQAGYGGYSVSESGQAYMHALELCRTLNNPPEVFSVIAGAGSFHITRGEFETSRMLADECLALADEQTRNPPIVIGQRLLGSTFFLTGKLRAAVQHLEEALKRYEMEPELYREADLIYTQDHKSAVSCYLGLAHTVLGNLDRGLESARSGLQHSECLGQLHTVNFSLTFLAAVLLFRREFTKALEYALRSYRMAVDQGFGTWVGIAQMMIGASQVSLGDPEKGMREITKGIEAYSSIEASTYKPFGISLLAKSLLAVGKHAEAMAGLDKALAIAEASGEQWYIPELCRLRGAVFIQQGDITRSHESLRHAMTLAHEQNATFWELRSASLLARSLYEKNRAKEASQVITPVFQRFSEGLDTADLKEARAVVDGLKAGLFAAAQHWRPEVTTSSRGRYPVNVSTR